MAAVETPDGPRPTRTASPRGAGAVALPALASGVGLALSLPPWGFWVLAFPAAGLLWWRLGGLRPRTRLWAGWLAGLGAFVPGLMFARAFTLAGAVVLIAVEALFVGVACLAVPRGPVVARALAFPAALTLAEAARQTWPFGGLPIGGVFLGQADGPVLGVARLGGPLGLTAAVYVGGVAAGALGLGVVRAARSHRRVVEFDRLHPEPGRATPWRRAVAGLGTLAATGVVALVGLVGGGVVAAHAPDGGPVVRTVTAAAVQGGGVRGFRKSQVDPSTVLYAAVAATDRLLPRPGVDPPALVLWPEDVVSLDQPLADDPEQGALSRLAVALHATLVVGVTENVSTTAFRNEVVAFGPDGAIVDRYEKVHRVPFGEYVPYRSFFAHLGNLSAVPLDAVPGTGERDAHDPGRPARHDDLLRGLLRRPGPLLGARRGPGADRAHQHLVLRHRPGADPGDRRQRGPGRAAGPRPAPGRAHRVLGVDHPPRGAARALGARLPPDRARHAGPARRVDGVRALG